MPRLRRVEHDGRGSAPRAARSRRPHRRAGRPEAAAARCRHRRRGAPPNHRSRGAGPRAGRRARRGLGRAGGRRPGHREVDARPPGVRRARAPGPARPLRRGRGVAGAGAAARRPPRHGRGRRARRRRDGGRGSRGADRRDASRRRRRRLDPNAPHRRPRLRARQRGTGARVGGAAGRAREGERRRLLSHRPRDQGGHARRPARARAPGRHRPLLRGRRRACAARAARRQEPLRLDQRGGGVRDGGGWARRGPEPVGRLPRRAAGRRAGLGRAGRAGGRPPPAGRDPGARGGLGARHAAPDRHRPRPGPRGAPPRRAREAHAAPAPRSGRVPERGGRAPRRRAGGRPGRGRRGRLLRPRPRARRRRGRVGRGRAHWRGARRRALRGAPPRGGAAGLPALRAPGLERAWPRGRRDAGRGGRRARAAVRGARAGMTFLALFWLNVGLLALFAVLLQREGLLGFAKGGKWYLTWFAVGLITLMDELTSIFYAPAEAHRFIGVQAIFFIAATSLLMRVLSTRMVEIAQILQLHNIRGGGVYSFSYFVLGPVASFVAVASLMVSYILTACIQTAGLVESWRDISKAYWFLALTVGIVTPLISALALSAPIDLAAHEGDLITHWATVVGNVPFGVTVGVVGSVILIMAVNTAYVASSELLERVAHRYRFDWLIATNRRASLYRLHCLNATLYTSVILLTEGSQAILAEMYAVSLLASFCIN